MSSKGLTTISVVIPAHDEERTIESIVRAIRGRLMDDHPLVDEIIVVDSRSRDRTAEVAAAAGARVVAQDDVLAHLPAESGKGEALWKGLASSSGDLVVFIDGDLHEFSPHFVTGLLGPLLSCEDIEYVKGFYTRPFRLGATVEPEGGGRVTELVARPLLNLFWPELAGFVQPLAGEYAGRRRVLERIPFVTHYGVEIGHLVDLLGLVGLDALAQVDLGHRRHRHRSTHELGRMAGQLMVTVLDRLTRAGRGIDLVPLTPTLVQFSSGASTVGVQRELTCTELALTERPPLASLAVPRP